MAGNRSLLVVHPTGNQNVRNVLKALYDADGLHSFHTTIALSNSSLLSPIARIFPAAGRRTFEIPSRKIVCHSLAEIRRLIRQRVDLYAGGPNGPRHAAVDKVYQSLDAAVSKALRGNLSRQIRAVYGYEDGSATMFEAAKQLGLSTYYELPIAYWRTSLLLLKEQFERWPDWACTMPSLFEPRLKIDRKTAEAELADVIICPSEFVAESLPATIRKSKEVHIVPFGSPDIPLIVPRSRANRAKPLRALFVGSMTQRKGLADLFAAMQIAGRSDIELTVMGSAIAPLKFYRDRYAAFRYEPPRAHHQVLALMAECDVFVLPSVVEGRALVVQEAMSCGLPAIITPNTGAADLIEEGLTGFLVPVGNPSAIAQKLILLAEQPELLREMSERAKFKALQVTWATYRRAICSITRLRN